MIILGIETSCDDTSCAIYDDRQGLLSVKTASQLEHAEFGGVVPEFASRAHTRQLLPVIESALDESGVHISDMDGVAVTYGPGLVGSLLVGVSAAKAIASLYNIPLIGIHHIEGHIYSNFIEGEAPSFPNVTLVISGGHSDLIFCPEPLVYNLMGSTRDDAAGEAFDKVGDLFGLEYPGGPAVEQHSHDGREDFHHFPRAKVDGWDFSFSGLKTAVNIYLKKQTREFISENCQHILASFQRALIDALIEKTIALGRKKEVSAIAVAGGVSANGRLRELFKHEAKKEDIRIFFPPKKYCTDNGAMIARAASERLKRGLTSPLTLSPEPRLPLP